ncbi:MAG: hypothetical protein INR69_06465 [Mucilaginibacter polytrichastri]|nr:hypothetical protein [Mucilaginibacter polytrichastri]
MNLFIAFCLLFALITLILEIRAIQKRKRADAMVRNMFTRVNNMKHQIRKADQMIRMIESD